MAPSNSYSQGFDIWNPKLIGKVTVSIFYMVYGENNTLAMHFSHSKSYNFYIYSGKVVFS